MVEASLSSLRCVGTGKPIFSQPSHHIETTQLPKIGSANPTVLASLPKELGQENGLKGPKVSAMRPEAGRSIPDQDEVVRKDDGGLQYC